MSAAIVRQALEVVDPDYKVKGNKKKSKPDVFSLFPEKYKVIGNNYKKSAKVGQTRLPVEKRYTVQDAKRNFKTKKHILEENLKKLELIKKHSRIVLDEHSTKNIIERAVTKRPIGTEEKTSRKSKTAFTEEDFKKFEEEYLNSED